MLDKIFNEIKEERKYQAAKWGAGSEKRLLEIDLEKNMPNDFVSYIANYSSKWFPGGFHPYKLETLHAFRSSMLKTAALACAAILWVDEKLKLLEK